MFLKPHIISIGLMYKCTLFSDCHLNYRKRQATQQVGRRWSGGVGDRSRYFIRDNAQVTCVEKYFIPFASCLLDFIFGGVFRATAYVKICYLKKCKNKARTLEHFLLNSWPNRMVSFVTVKQTESCHCNNQEKNRNPEGRGWVRHTGRTGARVGRIAVLL